LDLDKLSLGSSANGPSVGAPGGKKTLQRKGHFDSAKAQQQQQQQHGPPRKAQKDMTKKERRELQERQKAEKAAGLLKPSTIAKGKKNSSSGQQSSSNVGHHTLSAQSSVVDMGGRGSFLGSPQGTPSSTTMGGAVRSTPLAMRADDSKKRAKTDRAGGLHRVRSKKPVALFSHLVQYERLEHLTSELKAPGLIHPAVLSLGLQFSEFLLAGGHARCLAMLRVFQRVISDYVTPPGTSLQRHLTSHLSKQVDFLNSTRALAASMKSAIKELKLEISRLSIDLPDEDVGIMFLIYFQKDNTHSKTHVNRQSNHSVNQLMTTSMRASRFLTMLSSRTCLSTRSFEMGTLF
jgi:translation initiation factor eIF-2B subunit delta